MRAFIALTALLVTLPPCAAAAAGELPYSPESYHLRLELDPQTGGLEGSGVLALRAPEEPAGSPPLVLELHPDLHLDTVSTPEGEVTFERLPDPLPEQAEKRGGDEDEDEDEDGEEEDEGPTPVRWRVGWCPRAGEAFEIRVRWHGLLREDVAAGEKRGEIHNFRVRTHIAPEGIHLSDGSAWYPRLPRQDDDTPVAERRETLPAHFELAVREVPGQVLVASGDRYPGEPEPGWTTWRSPFPLDGVALHGGPHQVHRRQVGEVAVRVHLPAEAAPFAAGVLDAVESYLALYQPLLGPYPFRELAVVENFFSSGFAYPGFTVLGPGVIEMGPGALRPGYLDHEMLHNWWGNGVLASNLDGNWLEGLTSYCANYMRHVLEGRPEKAREQRRDLTQRLSLVAEPEPLGRFGLPEGPGNLIGYQKGAQVFAQLARTVGQETLWKALLRLFEERKGRPTGWDDIRRAVEATVEEASGRRPDLGAFFELWVRQGELPELTVESAVLEPEGPRLRLAVRRSGPSGPPLVLPLRLVSPGGASSAEVTVTGEGGSFTLELPEGPPPRALEVDPDYLLLRKVPARIVMPTLAGIFGPTPLTVFRAAEDLGGYDAVGEALAGRYDDEHADALEKVKGAFAWEALPEGHALVLGAAALSPDAAEVLEGAGVRVAADSFTVEGQEYAEPGDALLVCRRNPRDPGGVLCFYKGNGAEALARAYLLTFYGGNSLIVFRGGSPLLRRDFEEVERVEVQPGDRQG